jgi:predicted transcriptional regulator
MKTAISVPDDLFTEVEQLARRLKRSRSRVYADAIREYLARHDPDAITTALNRVHADQDDGLDPAVRAAGQQLLRSVDW